MLIQKSDILTLRGTMAQDTTLHIELERPMDDQLGQLAQSHLW